MKSGPYTLIIPPPGFPGKLYQGRYAYEHRVVFWQTHGYLPEIVHHDNERKRDNDPKNLMPKTNSVHASEHGRARRLPDVELTCGHCEEKFVRRARDVNWRIKAGQKNFYCSQRCGGLAMAEPMKHGSGGYQKGCRCVRCRAGHSERMDEYKKRNAGKA